MIAHLVLFRPRPDLNAEERRAFVDALKRAFDGIPSLRRVRVGVRVKLGLAYDLQFGQQDFTIGAMLEFDDLDGLQAYLAHPAHQALGDRFRSSAEIAQVYDYRMGDLDAVDEILTTAGLL